MQAYELHLQPAGVPRPLGTLRSPLGQGRGQPAGLSSSRAALQIHTGAKLQLGTGSQAVTAAFQQETGHIT